MNESPPWGLPKYNQSAHSEMKLDVDKHCPFGSLQASSTIAPPLHIHSGIRRILSPREDAPPSLPRNMLRGL